MQCSSETHVRVSRWSKGALGQALVRRYFEHAGWSVTPTGVEDVVDHLNGTTDIKKGDLANLPDFIVSRISAPGAQAHPLGQAFYVEVKTLKQWPRAARHQDLSRYLRWGHVLMVWVGPMGLRGAWLSTPGRHATRNVLALDDFKPLESVGTVSIAHCNDPDCERRLRLHFDALAGVLAHLPT